MNLEKRVCEQNARLQTTLRYIRKGYITIEIASKELGVPISIIQDMLSGKLREGGELDG